MPKKGGFGLSFTCRGDCASFGLMVHIPLDSEALAHFKTHIHKVMANTSLILAAVAFNLLQQRQAETLDNALVFPVADLVYLWAYRGLGIISIVILIALNSVRLYQFLKEKKNGTA
jgi:hypothetical protein